MPSEITRTLAPVIDAFDTLGIPYAVGGSVASSAFGIARSTLDADIVADMKPEHLDRFSALLKERFYLDENAIREAIQGHSSFNVIHLDTMLKVDVFVLKPREYDQQSFPRRTRRTLDEESGDGQVYVAAAEDVILNKLEWYEMGNRIAERQWNDVIGVLKVQGEALDYKYLHRWALELDLSVLLEKAIRVARE